MLSEGETWGREVVLGARDRQASAVQLEFGFLAGSWGRLWGRGLIGQGTCFGKVTLISGQRMELVQRCAGTHAAQQEGSNRRVGGGSNFRHCGQIIGRGSCLWVREGTRPMGQFLPGRNLCLAGASTGRDNQADLGVPPGQLAKCLGTACF